MTNGPRRATIEIIDLVNDCLGYIPDRRSYAEGNCEPESARCAGGSGEKSAEAAARLRAGFFQQPDISSGRHSLGSPSRHATVTPIPPRRLLVTVSRKDRTAVRKRLTNFFRELKFVCFQQNGWGRSSVGRAPQWHCGGQGFESPRLHHLQRCWISQQTRIFLRKTGVFHGLKGVLFSSAHPELAGVASKL